MKSLKMVIWGILLWRGESSTLQHHNQACYLEETGSGVSLCDFCSSLRIEELYFKENVAVSFFFKHIFFKRYGYFVACKSTTFHFKMT